RLGLAGALLGDPEILILDEPVNGLDPEGIRWVRSLVRALAAEGRSVLISSHLLSEMALTADHWVVIARGQLIADQPTYESVKEHSASNSLVRTDFVPEFSSALEEDNIEFSTTHDEEGREQLLIRDQTSDYVGNLAYSVGVPLTELSLKRASLEDAFMDLTSDSVQYHAESPRGEDSDASKYFSL